MSHHTYRVGDHGSISPGRICDDFSGAIRYLFAPEWWLGNIDTTLVPLVKDCLGAEEDAAKAEADGKVIELEDSEEDTAPQRIIMPSKDEGGNEKFRARKQSPRGG